MDIEELKNAYVARLSGHYPTPQFTEAMDRMLPAIVARLEAAQKFQLEIKRIASITPHAQTKEVLDFALAAFDKERP